MNSKDKGGKKQGRSAALGLAVALALSLPLAMCNKEDSDDDDWSTDNGSDYYATGSHFHSGSWPRYTRHGSGYRQYKGGSIGG